MKVKQIENPKTVLAERTIRHPLELLKRLPVLWKKQEEIPEPVKYWVDRKYRRKNPLRFFIENRHQYPKDVTRSQLFNTDQALYRALLRKGKLGIAIPEIRIAEPVDFGNDPLGYYNEHYPGKTRGQLPPSLHKRLKRDGLLDKVPRERAEPVDFGNDPLGYYMKHHPGKTRGQLYKENWHLYNELRDARLLKHVPTIHVLKKYPHEEIIFIN